MSIETVFSAFKAHALTYRQAVRHLRQRGLSLNMANAILCRAE